MKFQRQFWMGVTGRSGTLYTITSPITLELGVERGLFQSLSTGTFRIYNLKASTRSDLFHDWYDFSRYDPIVLRAGYASWNTVQAISSQSFPIIFKGNIRQAFSQREGPNWVTTILAWDGGYAATQGDITTVEVSGSPFQQQARTLIMAMPHVTEGYIDPDLKLNSSGATALVGNPRDKLQQLCNSAGAQLLIDNELVYIVATGDSVPNLSGGLGIITSNTGLLDTPQKQQTTLSFEMIFEPRVLVGQALTLQSIEGVYNGDYTVGGISHHGIISDAVGGDLRTKISCFVPQQFINP